MAIIAFLQAFTALFIIRSCISKIRI